jgi:hypothetical protein
MPDTVILAPFWLATKMSGNCQISPSDIELPESFWQFEFVRCDLIYRSASPTVASHRNNIDGQMQIHRTIRKLHESTHNMRPSGGRTERPARNSAQQRILVAGQPGKDLTIFIYSTSQDDHKRAACQPGKCESDHKFDRDLPG